MSSDALRVPPHNVEAERAVLAAVLLDNSALDRIGGRLNPGDFYVPAHRELFKAYLELTDRSQPIDAVTVSEALEERHLLEQIGGHGYLLDLINEFPTSANVRAYADIVRDRSILRDIIRSGTKVIETAYQTEGGEAMSALDVAEGTMFEVAQRYRGDGTTAGLEGVRTVLGRAFDHLETVAKTQGGITGISTGFTDLDTETAGLQRGDLIIVAGRPSMGKTSFAMNIAEHIAVQQKGTVAVFSLEMPKEHLVLRMLASMARVNAGKMRSGQLESIDFEHLTDAAGNLVDSRLFINDSMDVTLMDLRSQLRRMRREGPVDLVVIDYLQLMRGRADLDNRAQEISEISRGLKGLAKEMDCPVIALSQLNRSLEQRTNKRPMLSDLRESGAIEQDADVIFFVYREEVYLRNDESAKGKERYNEVKGKAEIIIGKQRNGPVGAVAMAFQGEYTRFANLIQEDFYR
ncbi:MAG: replicative DNA helicase [Alphaproteobacteria bacterium CG_4_10_14_0_2_um_filter_63_37]|nr:MAG: replicative DNA helicase [Proteobacteria bacterium CG1_02_64_396]PJA24608.1 MAG: replicative DNA helicase [Alphaproteobacteria bacterium CG_4_10_14_0_2_um_filter_63_37]